ncbi:MAG: homoserine kinase [Candidatus Wallbacteria bacterium]|nr:homoserine kinase [Candidatus Wallbacteria bacterium]
MTTGASQPVAVRVPATSGNLGPGFDTMGLALALHNIFRGRPAEACSFEATGSEAGELPPERPSENLIYRAVLEAYRHRGLEAPPFELSVDCRVPPARGLGSSATAIVAGLMIASRFLRPELERQELLDLSTRLEGHPDNVTAAIAGGLTASAVSADGRVMFAKLRLPASLGVLAVIPDYPLSTAEARAVLPREYSRADVVHNLSRVALLCGSLASGAAGDLWEALDDCLHQPYRAPLVKGFREVLAAARSAGAAGAFLSGAGPTILVLVRTDERRALAARLVRVLEPLGVRARVEPLGVEEAGARYTKPPA